MFAGMYTTLNQSLNQLSICADYDTVASSA